MSTAEIPRRKLALIALPTEMLLQIIEEALNPYESYSDHRAKESSVSWYKHSGIPLIFACKRLYALGQPIAIRHYTFDTAQLPSTAYLHRPIPPTQVVHNMAIYLRTDIYFDSSHFVRRVHLSGVDETRIKWERPAD
ncbi:hypothetical protein FQN49_002261 [Arthroderma sp. PD_2]|nr:hypothetical protein FQN49_002261 [Arthroderma sp. PD_2]